MTCETCGPQHWIRYCQAQRKLILKTFVPFCLEESLGGREPDVSCDPELSKPPQDQHPLLVLREDIPEQAARVTVEEQVGRNVRVELTRVTIVSLTETCWTEIISKQFFWGIGINQHNKQNKSSLDCTLIQIVRLICLANANFQKPQIRYQTASYSYSWSCSQTELMNIC